MQRRKKTSNVTGSNLLKTRRVDYTTTRGNVGASVADEPPVITAERTNHTGQEDAVDLKS